MDEINLNNFGVARRELFSPRDDIRLTFNKGCVYVNQYGIDLLSDVDYIKILFNRDDKTVAIVPSQRTDKDSICWTQGRDRKTKRVKALPLTYLILNLMKWNPYCRYVINGQMYRTPNSRIMLFKLEDAVCYEDISAEEVIKQTNKNISFPENWAINFGKPDYELDPINGIRIFENEMVFEEQIIIDEKIRKRMLEIKEKHLKEKEQAENDNI